jgi:hypothetical protein
MDELRHVQLLLKRERRFISFRDQEIRRLTAVLTQIGHRLHFHHKFHLFLAMTLLSDRALSFTPEFLGSLFAEGKDSNDKPPNDVALQLPVYTAIVSAFLADLPRLAAACVSLIEMAPPFAHQLTLQTLPGLFGYLWNKESVDRYLLLLKELFGLSREIASTCVTVLFLLLPFQSFLDQVMDRLINRVPLVKTPAQASEFASDFVESWYVHIGLCPSVIRKALLLSEDPSQLLTDAFLLPALNCPRVFRLVPLSMRPAELPLVSQLLLEALPPRSEDLWKAIERAADPKLLPSFERLVHLLPDFANVVLCTTSDLDLLVHLAIAAHLPGPATGPPAPSDTYCTYLVPLPTAVRLVRPPTPLTLSAEDEIERQLRELLTTADVIPLAQAGGRPDMVDILKGQLQLARPERRPVLEMKIDDMESFRSRANLDWTFVNYVEILRRNFEARERERLEQLSHVAALSADKTRLEYLVSDVLQQVAQLRKFLSFALVESWLETNARVAPPDVHTDTGAVASFFNDAALDWNAFAQDRGAPASSAVLHSALMRDLPREAFILSNPRDDRPFRDTLRTRCHAIVSTNTFGTAELMQDAERLLEPARAAFVRAFEEPLPLQLLGKMAEAWTSFVRVQQIDQKNDPGEDEYLPMTIGVLALADLEQLPATVQWLCHFIDPLEDTAAALPDDERRVLRRIDGACRMLEAIVLREES